ncbi:hypothetical protein EMCRGX_G023071 [Ephydatia muelleri]
MQSLDLTNTQDSRKSSSLAVHVHASHSVLMVIGRTLGNSNHGKGLTGIPRACISRWNLKQTSQVHIFPGITFRYLFPSLYI